MRGPQNVKDVSTLQDRNLIFLKRVSKNNCASVNMTGVSQVDGYVHWRKIRLVCCVAFV